MRWNPYPAAVAALGALCAAADAADAAPDDDLRKEFEEFRRHAAETEAEYRRRIGELERRLAERETPAASSLQTQIDDLLDRIDAVDAKAEGARSAAAPRASWIEIGFNSLFVAGTSTAPNDRIFEGLEGGHHDPHRRGFTVQNTELVLSGAVDPYFRGFANMVQTIDEDGETVVELEEAYAQTTSLPYGLQVKAGLYFTEFGRQNPTHPHQWEFVDQPVVITRLFSDDAMRGAGARVSWLAPTEFPLELIAGVQNANGNPMASFAGPGEDGPPIGEDAGRSVRALDELVWSGRASASFDLTDEMPLLVGVSGALGPSGASSSGDTSILGADVTLKWKPLASDRGFPFVAFQAECLRRHVGFDGFVDDTAAFVPGGELRDSGGYAQAVWGFRRDWTVGLRFDRVNGTDDEVFGRDDRNRLSLSLTHYASEFAKIRLQVNEDDAAALGRHVTSVWLQLEFDLGAHGAHEF